MLSVVISCAVSVVVPRICSAFMPTPGAVHRAPLLHAGAGHGLTAVAALFGLCARSTASPSVAAALDKGVEQLGGLPAARITMTANTVRPLT